MEIIGEIWNLAVIRPMINSLALLYIVFFSNFGIAIIVFTMIVRGILIPLTVKQSRQMRKMSTLQPKLKEAQEKYKDDRPRLSQETMKVYRENGVNPVGCLGPLVIQFPIWIGLFWALRAMLPSTPESLVGLSGQLYDWLPVLNQAIPLNTTFLIWDLGQPDQTQIILPVLVGASMFVMQKMTSMPAMDPRQESTNKMMLYMMPLLFGFFTLQFQSGLAVYWVVSNIAGVVIQGFVTGWDPILSLFSFRRPKGEITQDATAVAALASSTGEIEINEDNGDDGQNSRRSNRNRPKGARRRARGGRGRRR